MNDKEKWREMVAASKNAKEEFNDFADDRAIIYAADLINNMRNVINNMLVILDDYSGTNGEMAVIEKGEKILGEL